MKKRLLLTALLVSSLTITGHAYGAERVVVNAGQSAIIDATEDYIGITNSTAGGAVYTAGKLTVDGTTFKENSSSADGGAMRIEITTDKVNSPVNISGATFTGNKAMSAGADSGAISIRNGIVNITGTTFKENKADIAGAIYAYTGNAQNAPGEYGVQVNIENCLFDNNEANSIGAIGNFATKNVLATGGMTIKNTEFTGNDSIGTDSVGGGALFLGAASQTKLENVTFSENTSKTQGGAIATRTNGTGINNSGGNLTIIGGSFDNNYADKNGGAIATTLQTVINGTKFDKNKSGYTAGAIAVQGGNLTITDSDFTNNESSFGGAIFAPVNHGGFDTNSVVTITDSLFQGNKAAGAGAVGLMTTTTITDSKFISNQATDLNDDGGGAIFVGSESITKFERVVFEGNTSKSVGGAIATRANSAGNNTAAKLDIIDSTFTANQATGQGGAIYNAFFGSQTNPAVVTIDGSTFDGNSSSVQGGAIYNAAATNTSNVSAIKITDTVLQNNYSAGHGGAIYSAADMTLDNVTATGNYTTGDYTLGGVIYTTGGDAVIKNSEFTGNESVYAGGAIFAGKAGTVDIDNVTFKDNTSEFGGAIYAGITDNTITIKNSVFDGNSAKDSGAVSIGNKGIIENTIFRNNSATGSAEDGYEGGGAVYLTATSQAKMSNVSFDNNSSATVGGAIAVSDTTSTNSLVFEITDASFTNNSAAGEGGAIYSAADMAINAQDSNVVFSGNTASDGGDIYMADANTTLSVNVADDKSVTLGSGVSGVQGYTVAVESVAATGATEVNGTGALNLDSYLKGANMSVTNATLALGSNADISSSKVAITDGGFNTANGVVESYGDNVTFSGSVDVTADVNLATGKGDNLSEVIQSNSTVNIAGVNAIGNTTANNVTLDLKKALGLTDPNLNVTFDASAASDVLTPVRYLKGSVNNDGTVSYAPRGNAYKDFNSAIMTGPMAAQLGGYLTQLNSYDQAFMNLDMKMLLTREERQAMRMRNSYASTTTPQVFSPTYLPEEQKGGWVRPYASFEKVGLDGGPKVSNVMYGTFFGADSEMYELKNGAQAQFSVYAGYNGSHQAYNGNGIYQNGGTLGLTGIVYKDNFFTALTANAGASIADASTMYGSEDIPMMMAGVASKTGYNWELAKGKLIVQPNYLMSYSFVNTFNYTNAAGVKIESDPLNAIQIAPGVKFIGNLKNGWQPYVNLRMMWNLMDKTDFRAANTALPQLSVKPYFEYGVGLQKRWGERFTGFGQAMLRAGGRNGVALGFGFRWALGKAPSKAYTSNDSKNIVQPTTVKLSNIK